MIPNIVNTENILPSFLSSLHPLKSHELWGLWWWNGSSVMQAKLLPRTEALRVDRVETCLCGQFVSWLNMNMEKSPMMDSQRSHCQQIISSTVCCTCIPVTKWCHWYTGEPSRRVRLPDSAWRRCCRAQPGGTQGQSVESPILARVHLVKLETVVVGDPFSVN